jgi:hypothetical protein
MHNAGIFVDLGYDRLQLVGPLMVLPMPLLCLHGDGVVINSWWINMMLIRHHGMGMSCLHVYLFLADYSLLIDPYLLLSLS